MSGLELNRKLDFPLCGKQITMSSGTLTQNQQIALQNQYESLVNTYKSLETSYKEEERTYSAFTSKLAALAQPRQQYELQLSENESVEKVKIFDCVHGIVGIRTA